MLARAIRIGVVTKWCQLQGTRWGQTTVTMIEFYHQIALKLEKASLLIWLGLIASSVFCGYVIFFEQSIVKSDQELSAVVLPLWFLSMIALKSYFAEITPKPSKDIGILKRLWGYIKRSFNWFIALVFSGIRY